MLTNYDISIIGAGGIGSYFISHVNDLRLKKQILPSSIQIYDFDTVDNKNLFYQNFNIDELGYLKSDCLANRYNARSHPIKITSFDTLFNSKINIIVLCVDNWQTRKQFFHEYYDFTTNGHTITAHKWIDMRSHGRQISAYTSNSCTKEQIFKTLPDKVVDFNEPAIKGNNSCQNPFDMSNNVIQLGNVIIASLGAQMLLNMIREETGSTGRFEYVI